MGVSSIWGKLLEEAVLTADLRVCATVIVAAGERVICLYVFSGEVAEGEAKPSSEGPARRSEYK
jgi:hypothetical protein